MLKPNRLVALATSGQLAETAPRKHRYQSVGDSLPVSDSPRPPANSSANEELLESLTNGLHRLCELAFGPNEQVHQLAAKAVAAWTQNADLAVDSAPTAGQAQSAHRVAVRLLTAVAVYLELCQREQSGTATGVIETAALSRLFKACEGHVPPDAAARCPALRRLLHQFQTARSGDGRTKRIAAA